MKLASLAVPIVALGMLALLDSLGKTSDPDIFWHLSTARTALETHSTLPRDIFSFSVQGAPWLYKDLVAEVLLYVGFARIGFAWFATLKFVVAGAVIFATHLQVRRPDRNAFVFLVAAGLTLDSFWLVERPNLFSLGLFALAFASCERARRLAEQRAAPTPAAAVAGALLPVVAINVAWTWLHRFAVLGHLLLVGLAVLLVAASLLSEHPSARALLGPRPSRRFVLATLVAAIASPALSLLNPNGVAVFTSASTMATHPELRAQFFEWKRATLHELLGAFPLATALALLAVVGLVARLVRAVRARDESPPVTLGHAAVLAALVGMTADSLRWVPYLAIASGLVLASLLADLRARARRPIPRGASLLAALVLLGLLRVRQGDTSLGIGEDPAWSPRGAVDFASAHGLHGRVANAFDFGGYLMWRSWPSVQVLIDGRNELVYDPSFVRRALLAEHDAPTFAAMRAQDGATWALTLNTSQQVGGGFLARDPAWWLVYWSDTAAVYARRDAHPELAPESFLYVDPFDVPGSIGTAVLRARGDRSTLSAIITEVRRMHDASPDSIRANLALLSLAQSVSSL